MNFTGNPWDRWDEVGSAVFDEPLDAFDRTESYPVVKVICMANAGTDDGPLRDLFTAADELPVQAMQWGANQNRNHE